MEIRVLGPVEVHVGGAEIPIEGAQQQCVLGLLAAHHGSYVPVGRLIEALWEDDPPKTAKTIVQLKVSQLRKSLGERIASTTAGYALDVPPDEVDLGCFRRLAAEGRAADRPEDATAAWARALDLWRGQPLQGIGTAWVEQRIRGPLLRERWDLLEEHAAALIELGRHREVPALLQELRDEEPLRETPHALAMTALWHDGRPAEALELYHDVQRTLAGELGVDPGPRLRDLHQRIVEGHRPVTPRQLPRDVAGFVGRQAEAERLRRLLRGGRVAVVTGAAGIGKSALAVHVGHQLAADFPDGQLHVDLNGHGQGDPLPPERVLPRLLGALGVPAGARPTGAAEQLDLYRSTLATRRVLLLLDNAAHAEQVRPLLPGGSSCAVLVTSRDALRGLALQGARSVRLGTFTPGESRDLLADLVGDDLVSADPAAVAELAELCGHLPLALAIAGANLIGRAGLHEYIKELHADRWSTLAVEGDAQATVAAAFAGSYAALPPEAQVLFRRFGLVPGCDFTASTAARLAGADQATAKRLLARLASAHLIEEHAPGRYRLHDLVALYAREHCTARDDDPAPLHAYYLHSARAAAPLLAPSIELLPLTADDPPCDGEEFADAGAASAWFQAEQHNLLAVMDQARGRVSWRLVETLRAFVYQNYPPDVVIALATRALDEAERAGDRAGQAGMHHTLANASLVLSEPREAIRHCELASELYAEIGWETGVQLALTNLVVAKAGLGDLHESMAEHERIVRLWEAREPTTRLAGILENYAIKLLWAGRAREALERQLRAIRIWEEHGGRPAWEGRAYSVLGGVHVALGDLGQAIGAYEHALAWAKDAQLAGTLSGAAIAHHLREDGARAAELARRAVREAPVRGPAGRYEEARGTLARVDASLGLDERLSLFRDVLARYRDRNYPYFDTRTRVWLAEVLLESGRRDESAAAAGEALEAAARYGLRRLEGQALTVLAQVKRSAEDARRAVELHREYGHRLDEARARAVLAQVV
ncbi:AfsR/SARP family transcriptional regulator [Nonomuraea turcica]|uniref:AfsR/SARP family transcriptional regulator n=1 Tax=Nonomuraea sp. G32 TaxID=3067274 RepID=UPI00273C873F|nr:BTAD domain-containing putative transcriptional regulator [Nonomuraea sp. G32]MDP4502683.1 BTAD domain-containing putative transcriptional regulator [Nonomuraea sp. G32]